jgi:hypothetical protein
MEGSVEGKLRIGAVGYLFGEEQEDMTGKPLRDVTTFQMEVPLTTRGIMKLEGE